MKLMKFLVVALVAGSVFTSATGVAHDCEEIEKPSKPVPGEAGEVDGKAVMCQYTQYTSGKPFSDSSKDEGTGLYACEFSSGSVYEISIRSQDRPRRYARRGYGHKQNDKYESLDTKILWGGHPDHTYSLNRKTLELKSTPIYGSWMGEPGYAQCELISPDEIKAYFQPYIDYGNALDEKRRSENKI